jgi:DNA-binding HxlR family transcriptional regulator
LVTKDEVQRDGADWPRGNVFDLSCPSRRVLDRVGNKWTLLVVECLQEGSHRFSELRRRIGGVSQKVLTQTLRTMERDGLVTRTVYAEVPPRVEYALTELGNTLITAVDPIARWAEEHIAAIDAAQRDYDAERARDAV